MPAQPEERFAEYFRATPATFDSVQNPEHPTHRCVEQRSKVTGIIAAADSSLDESQCSNTVPLSCEIEHARPAL